MDCGDSFLPNDALTSLGNNMRIESFFCAVKVLFLYTVLCDRFRKETAYKTGKV